MRNEAIIRRATPADAGECARVMFSAFASSADYHHFPREFASVEAALDETRVLLAEPLLHGVVAEHNGQIVGSNFIDMRSPVAGIGPITVDPAAQNRGLGRRLMQACLDHADSANAIGVRLGHAAYNHRSFALYSRLGFRVGPVTS